MEDHEEIIEHECLQLENHHLVHVREKQEKTRKIAELITLCPSSPGI